MKYDHDTDDAHRNLFDNLQAMCTSTPTLGEVDAGEEELDIPSLAMNQRLDLDVECWGNRIA